MRASGEIGELLSSLLEEAAEGEEEEEEIGAAMIGG